jgi:hypothetical protein
LARAVIQYLAGAGFLANEPSVSKHCLRIGERRLIVMAGSEKAFRRALLEAGYLVAPTKAKQEINPVK